MVPHHAPDPTAAGRPARSCCTASPATRRRCAALAEAFAAAGFHVELPRLPGHGTTVEDMLTTGWADWTAEVEAAYQRLAARAGQVVVAGLSMGGSLTLWTALAAPRGRRPRLRQPGDAAAAGRGAARCSTSMLAGGTEVDARASAATSPTPTATRSPTTGTPVRPLLSFIDDGLAPLAARYGELTMPLLLFTSRQDHVVEPSQSEYLAAHYGGPVDHRWLERSYHVATQDFDRDVINVEAVAFASDGRPGPDRAASLASIPSPSSGRLEIGPLSLNAYGLMIALGVVAGVWLFGRRLEERNIGTREDANAIAVWGVLAGVIGARLYHVLTDWERFEGNLGRRRQDLGGRPRHPRRDARRRRSSGVYVGHRRGIPLGPGLNAVAPALPLAQAIGRWGNYFNQELYGRPTDLPWALEIDDEHLPATGQYPSGTTFHPTFLYESLWNLALVGAHPLARQALQVGRRAAAARCTCSATASAASGSRACASTRPTSSARSAGTSGSPSPLIVGGGGYLVADARSPRERVYEPQPVRAEHRPRRHGGDRHGDGRPERRRVRDDDAPDDDDADRRHRGRAGTSTTARRPTRASTPRPPERRPLADEDDGRRQSRRTAGRTTSRRPDQSRAPVAASKRCTRSGRGTRCDAIAGPRRAEALGAGDDRLARDGVGRRVGAVEERLRAELLDDGDLDLEPARGLQPPVLRAHADRDRVAPSSAPRCSGVSGTVSVPCVAPSSRRPSPSSRFICGEPMNPATKRLTGSVNRSFGDAHCCSTPWSSTATRSPIVIASTWSWVT